MGYTTDFYGEFKLNKVLDKHTHDFLKKLCETRRMARDAAKLRAKYGEDFGIEGEFFVEGAGFAGQDHDETILDYNTPPKTQPGLWCHWYPTEDGKFIEWDGGEKFYYYVEWLQYIIEKILAPRGYKLTGSVDFQGEDPGDFGKITVKSGKVLLAIGKRTLGKSKQVR